MLKHTNGKWKCYNYSKEDKLWIKKNKKEIKRLKKSGEQIVCENLGHKFTRGENDEYPGCDRCWCCNKDNSASKVKILKKTKPKKKIIIIPKSRMAQKKTTIQVDNEWDCYNFTKEDKLWIKKNKKEIIRRKKTGEEIVCNKIGNTFTRGKNEDYPGCEQCWCCKPKTPKPRIKFKKKKKPVKTQPKPLVIQDPELLLSNAQKHISPKIYFEPPYNRLFIEYLQILQDITRRKGEFFRSSAYRKAKESIQMYREDINNVITISSFKNVGKSIVSKMTELINTGKIKFIEESKIQPEQVFGKIFGIGPKKARELYSKYGIGSIKELEQSQHLLNAKQKIGLKYYNELSLRIPRIEIDEYKTELQKIFEKIRNKDSVFEIVGSYRRGLNTSGDIDIIISDPSNDKQVYKNFIDSLIQSNILVEILSRGRIKCLGISKLGRYAHRRIDFMFSTWEQFSFAKLYFTGSQAFNTSLRARALEYGVSMNEHTFTPTGKKKLKKTLPSSFPNEKSIFDYLDLEYLEPHLRIDGNSLKLLTSEKKLLSKQQVSKVSPDTSCVSGNTGKKNFSATKGVLLASEYIDRDGRKTVNPTGWWASEKFDGYRAIWNGQHFESRNGKPYNVPEWFSALMPPNIPLDGELWMGRECFESCGIFRRKVPNSEQWLRSKVVYKVFDLPNSKLPFEKRMDSLYKIVQERCNCMVKLRLPMGITTVKCPIEVTQQVKVKSEKHLDDMFQSVVKKGGEGVMIRQAHSQYEHKRSKVLLKYKQIFDTEAIIVGYNPGTGKYKGMLGSFICRLLKGKNTKDTFKISGMNDEIRSNYKSTHPIGTVVTIVYNDFTKKGIPRHPRYLRKRDDHDL